MSCADAPMAEGRPGGESATSVPGWCLLHDPAPPPLPSLRWHEHASDALDKLVLHDPAPPPPSLRWHEPARDALDKLVLGSADLSSLEGCEQVWGNVRGRGGAAEWLGGGSLVPAGPPHGSRHHSSCCPWPHVDVLISAPYHSGGQGINRCGVM